MFLGNRFRYMNKAGSFDYKEVLFLENEMHEIIEIVSSTSAYTFVIGNLCAVSTLYTRDLITKMGEIELLNI